MNNDMMKALHELGTISSTLFPEIDVIKLKSRFEEVLNNYDVQIKEQETLQKDMLNNIKLYISSKRLEGLSESTLEDYYQELTMFDNYIQKSTRIIATTDIRKYLSDQGNNMISTVSKKLSIIKSFFSWLVDEELLLKNPANKIKQIKQPKRLPKALSSIELEMIREGCISERERALIEVLYSTGCRLFEISSMKRSGVDWQRGSMKIIGKGNKERVVYLNSKAIYYLKKYLNICEEEENVSEYLFSTVRRPNRKMQERTIQDAVTRIANRTKVSKNVTPHVFRHTMATLSMENGIELGDLQQLLGHENPSTTLRYAAVSEERKKNAHRRFVQ